MPKSPVFLLLASIVSTALAQVPTAPKPLGPEISHALQDLGNVLVPKGPAPKITSLQPVEPDGTPWAYLGDRVTILGENFGTDPASIWIVIAPAVDPAAPPKNGPSSDYAELHPESTQPTKLSVTSPQALPGAPATFSVWVATAMGGWSNPMSMYFGVRATPPTITQVTPQYPGLRTIAKGSGFKLGQLVQLTSGGTAVQTRFVDSGTLEITWPQGLSPGTHLITVAGSAPFPAQILAPVPYELYARDHDRNGMRLNPKWGWQLVRAQNAADYYPDPARLLAMGGAQGRGTDNMWLCAAGNFFEDLFGDHPYTGHVNWYPVTYEVRNGVTWSSFDDNDEDYNFWVVAPEGSGGTVYNEHQVKLEFAADETINYFTDGWWNDFRASVGSGFALNKSNHVSGTVTGLYGLDCAHECHPELHPVWALALSTYTGVANREAWQVFARNWGDEGYCSTHDHRIYFARSRYVVRIPWRTDMTSAQVSIDMYNNFDPNARVEYALARGEGIYLSIPLTTPDRHPLAWGTVNVTWSTGAVALAQMAAVTADAPATPTPQANGKYTIPFEERFREFLKKQPQAKREAFEREAHPPGKKTPAATKQAYRMRGQAVAQVPAPGKAEPTLKSVADAARQAQAKREVEALARSGIISEKAKNEILAKPLTPGAKPPNEK